MKRPAVLILVILAGVAGLALSRPPAAGAASDRLPDLGMARLRDLSIDTATVPGRRLLRFTTIIVNIGAGPFETIGSRPTTSTAQMAVAQRIYNTAGPPARSARRRCCSGRTRAKRPEPQARKFSRRVTV